MIVMVGLVVWIEPIIYVLFSCFRDLYFELLKHDVKVIDMILNYFFIFFINFV